MQDAGSKHDGKDRPQRQRQRADADRPDRRSGHPARRTDRIEQRSARHLADETDQAADRQDEADIALGPRRRRQVDGNKRPETGLQVGDKENEPIEGVFVAARASYSGIGRPFGTDDCGPGVERNAAQRTVIVLEG
jgi:hypothetical protein